MGGATFNTPPKRVEKPKEEAQAFLKGMKAKRMEDGNRQGKEGHEGS